MAPAGIGHAMRAGMNIPLARRTASNIRAALVIVAFSALAAVGFATAQSLHPLTPAVAEHTAPTTKPASVAHKDLYSAPGACPLPAGAFNAR